MVRQTHLHLRLSYTSGENDTPDPLALGMVKHDFNYRYLETGGVETTPLFDGQIEISCTQDAVTGYLSLGSYDLTDSSIATHATGGSMSGCILTIPSETENVGPNGIHAVGWDITVVTSVDQVGTKYDCDDEESVSNAVDIIGADPDDHHLCD